MYIVPGSPSCAFALCVSGSGAEGEEEEEEEEEQQQQQQQQQEEEEDGSLDDQWRSTFQFKNLGAQYRIRTYILVLKFRLP